LEVNLRILDTPEEMAAVEDLQRLVWPGNETEIVPIHVLITAAHNGGLLVGAFPKDGHQNADELIGFVFGFPGLYFTPDGPRPKHCSHMLGVHPDYRDEGIGFLLKRAQWQMIRHQGLDLITWTFDPLLSRNAYLNIGKLGAVCNIYLQNVYGELRDEVNTGITSDRFQVDWWINTRRVFRRLSKKARPPLDMAHFLAAGAGVVNPSTVGDHGWPQPVMPDSLPSSALNPITQALGEDELEGNQGPLLLVEIPSDFIALKAADPGLAQEWRLHIRILFEDLFTRGYLIIDFVHLQGTNPRSFYVLSHGEKTL
jgi:predicted GNAT superfamily acetyltransferase